MKSIQLFAVILACCLDLQAGVQDAWIRRYNAGGNTGTNQAVAAVRDRQGNLIVAGSSTSPQGDFDYVILKYTAAGSNVWVRRYTSFNVSDDQVRAMALDDQDQIYVTGTSVTIKHAPDGTQLWTAPYGGRALAPDTNGNVYVTGYLTNDFATVKLDSIGSNVWERTHDMIGQNDVSHQVSLDSEQNVYVVGPEIWAFEPRQPAYYQRFRLISYTPQGSVRFTYQMPAGYHRTPCEVRSLYALSNTVVFTGNINLGGPGGAIYSTFKIDLATSSNWFAGWVNGSSIGETASSVQQNGDIFLTGGKVIDIGRAQIVTVKVRADQLMINDLGTPTWRSDYAGSTPGFNRANAIGLDQAGNVYVSGQSSGAGTSDSQDWATIKYSPEGKEQWVKRFNGPAQLNDVATCMAVAPHGQVYVAGWSQVSSNLTELVVIKYAELENLQVQPDRASLQFFGTPGQTYRIDASTNLPFWDILALTTADADGIYRYDDTNAANFPFRFYRSGPP